MFYYCSTMSVWMFVHDVCMKENVPECRAMYDTDYSILLEVVAWLSGSTLDSINEVTLCQARLVLGWVTVCGQVNHLSL